MNAETRITAQAESLVDRELREVLDVEVAAQRLAHELRKVAYWRAAMKRAGVSDETNRLLCRVSERAEECRVTLMGAIAAWSEIDAVHDRWIEMGGGE